MKVKMILPALTEAISPFFRPIKYSLFPPLGLATLAGYLTPDDHIEIVDEHVEKVKLDDKPDLVAIQVYITSAYRSYQIADHYRKKGIYVVLGGLHVTTQPNEAKNHADTIILGPGEDTFPQFIDDFRKKTPKPIYQSKVRTLDNLPPIRRDLIKRQNYLVPNSIVISRGCPHHCDFCYKDSFYKGGRSFYTQKVDVALKEINSLPGRHLYFLDDHLFANPTFAESLFDGMKGMNRVWQSAGTVQSILKPNLIEKAVESGLRSIFIGFETLNSTNLFSQNKYHNLNKDYSTAIKKLHGLGVMINVSFVYGMDEDDPSVFDRTVNWALENGLETSTFHILTPYPGTKLYHRMMQNNRIVNFNWDDYDTRHAVFQPSNMSIDQLEKGYWRSYEQFYKWSSIFKSVSTKDSFLKMARHFAYSAGWKKFELLWDMVIQLNRLTNARGLLEKVLDGFSATKAPKAEVGNRVLPSANLKPVIVSDNIEA